MRAHAKKQGKSALTVVACAAPKSRDRCAVMGDAPQFVANSLRLNDRSRLIAVGRDFHHFGEMPHRLGETARKHLRTFNLRQSIRLIYPNWGHPIEPDSRLRTCCSNDLRLTTDASPIR